MFTQIVTHMRRFISLTAEEEALLVSKLSVKDVKKKEHLLQAGQVCHDNYFIVNGK